MSRTSKNSSKINAKLKGNLMPEYYCTGRLVTELVTLNEEKRKVKYLSPFAPPPSVSEHVTGLMLIGSALGYLIAENKKPINRTFLLSCLLWHDAPEARYGDIGRDQRRYVSINEQKALADAFGSVTWGTEVIDIIEQFEAGTTDIAVKAAKDADALYVIYTIKDLLQKGFVINDPDMRIQKTLKRLSTEEAFNLGVEMSQRDPREIKNLIRKYNRLQYKNDLLHSESVSTVALISWALLELRKLERKNGIDRGKVIETILFNKLNSGKIGRVVNDANKIYKILATRRAKLQGKNVSLNFSGIFKSLKTVEGKKLAQILTEIDLYEWWNILMGYGVIDNKGRFISKLR
ncbi:hypothetical protein A3F07_04685 [candidate division WWE3 bacterium RIFCSPHIGHO2_12_FULL_38_15]|uniref:HD domain-containing protein n=1 Tax=candidate division WWE3 bacterium RIFCSPHIGHO2_02_FULL_38_14 TaxID=1802620 RepID=A0A1F4V852_UNCKA|nr:MAG: hypothetical protein A2793_00315 [candidate division WWE3 bacterium RIFCSPHIGHO2_01_FULL_38_45]OGC49537.1 MAG: hypothetical protein A3F07_04685 [candidate division WWE3 bacterium RIFCSPHIGHO2_12_FULL_38_15]OGC52463.1 MAG: hypothetical protein A3B64_02625 [candidate division WWE3 bacterium RIFCSPLOWO2_01_FULL_37_24]OGC53294.1 MAG: hypothetical protein A3D91_02680 [candidate division WWE3 bacterium RIFCSPHIGHO2_02_FULL_38_14]HLB51802.1 HD domain-containing protein [Patescibacteria group b